MLFRTTLCHAGRKMQTKIVKIHKLSGLFEKAKKVYTYATTNTTDIIEKPLLTRHNKGLNGVIDLKNKVSAKYFAVGKDGLESKLVMLFKFGGEKFKVVKNYIRDSKFSKWKAAE